MKHVIGYGAWHFRNSIQLYVEHYWPVWKAYRLSFFTVAWFVQLFSAWTVFSSTILPAVPGSLASADYRACNHKHACVQNVP